MRLLFTFTVLFLFAPALPASAQTVAPTGTLRAAYLAGNPAQSVRDATTGEVRGVAIDLTRELGRRIGVPVNLIGLGSPQNIIDAVQRGEADIGFVAYNPERAGPVEFSQPYLLVQQTFLVRENSTISSVAEIDRPNQRIGGGKGDSIALYLARNLKQSQLVEVDSGINDAMQMLLAGKIDAFGANRQRLTDVLRSVSGLRLLPDDLYGVEQTIIVPKDRSDALKNVNQFINDVRTSGLLRSAVERSGVVGISIAPSQ